MKILIFIVIALSIDKIMIITGAAVAATTTLTSFKDEKSSKKIHTEINDYADKLMQRISVLIITNGKDPTNAPDIHEGLSYTILFITYYGGLDLTSGVLKGISTIHREGNMEIAYDTNTKKMTIIAPISFNILSFTYDYKANIMGLGPRGKMTGTIDEIVMRATIGFDFQQFHATLDKLEVLSSGTITLKFTGNILLDWLVNLITTVATTALHRVILIFVEVYIRDGISATINDINQEINQILYPSNSTSFNQNFSKYSL